MTVVQAFWRLRLGNGHEFKAGLGNMMSWSLPWTSEYFLSLKEIK